MKTIRNQIFRNSLLRDFLTVLSGNGMRLIIGMGSSVLIVRSLGPDSYGTFALLTAVIAITASLSDFGLTPTAVQSIAASSRANQIARTYLETKTISAILFALFGILFSRKLSFLIAGDDRLVFLLRLSFTGVLSIALSNAAGALLHAARRFPLYTGLLLVNPLLMLSFVGYWWATGGIQLTPLIELIVILPLIHAALAFLRARKIFSGREKEQLLAGKKRFEEVWRLLSFSKWIFIASAMAALFSQIDLFLVRKWGGGDATGYYALALSLAMKAAILNGSLVTTLLPRVSGIKTAEMLAGYLKNTFRKTLPFTLLIGISLPLVKPVILVLYGNIFLPAVPLTIILLLMVAVNLNVLPFSLLLYPLNRPHWLAAMELSKLLIFIVLTALSMGTWGATGIALSKLFSELIVGLVYLLLTGKFQKILSAAKSSGPDFPAMKQNRPK